MSDDQVVLEDNVPLPSSLVRTSSRQKYVEVMHRMEVGQSFVVDDVSALGAITDPTKNRAANNWTCIARMNSENKGHKKWTGRWVEKYKSIRVWRVL